MAHDFSLARLFVLGSLFDHPLHGYDLVTKADLWGVSRWAGISIGTIYNSVNLLSKGGHIVAGPVEKMGNRPEKRTLSLTESGQDMALNLVRHGLSSLNFEGREVDMALAFAGLLEPDERSACLRKRMTPLNQRLAQLQHWDRCYAECLLSDSEDLKEFKYLKTNHPWIASSINHGLRRIELECHWTEELIAQVAAWPSLSSFAGVA